MTGAARGIGRRCAERLVADGFSVVAADVLPWEGEAGVVESEYLDVTDPAAVDALMRRVGGDLWGVVSAAGILQFLPDGRRPMIHELTDDDWGTTNAVNATGTFNMLRAFLRQRHASPAPGRFVGFSSTAAQLGGYRSSASYIASKSAVLGLMKAGAREAAAMGVTVNTVAPGLIDAPMLRLSLPEGQEAQAAAAIPLGRLGTADDVAGAVSFLMGEDAAYVTGAVIDVNGGYRMQ